MSEKVRANKILSAVMGHCVADSLGVPVEFYSRDALMLNPVTDMRGYGTHGQPPGTWSDDTSMMLCTIHSLTNTNDEIDYSNIMDNFIKWYKNGEFTPFMEAFDIGISTRNALECYEAGMEALECGGTGEKDNGNGSLMRVLPLIFYIQVKYGIEISACEITMEQVHKLSSLTHGHKRSQIACGIYLTVAANLIEGMTADVAIRLGVNNAIKYYKKHPEFALELNHFSRLIGADFQVLSRTEIKSSGYVIDTLEAALWCLLNSNSYKECVIKAVNLGEDTDTVAAIAGGLAGIYYGYENIPKVWINTIIKKDYVEQLAMDYYKTLTRLSVEKILKYVSYFETATAESAVKFSNMRFGEERPKTVAYRIYDREVRSFISELKISNLLVKYYNDILYDNCINNEVEMIVAIESSQLELVKAILSYFVLEEINIDGLWEVAIEERAFLKIIKRLDLLTEVQGD